MSKKFRERILQGSGFSNVAFESEYGMKLMKAMGWTEGTGLGKSASGNVDCLQIKRRDDQLGLGFDKAEKFRWSNNWWENSYNDSIKSFNLDYKAEDSEPEKTTDTSDEEGGPNENRLKRRKNRLNYKDEEAKVANEEAKEKTKAKAKVEVQKKLKKSAKKVEVDTSSDEESEYVSSEDEEKEEKILSNSKKIKKSK